MIVGSLFAGIGGFDEGLRQAGMESSWQVEKEPFCLKVLKTRFPNAERAADILTCRGLTSSVPASHARIGRSRERERDCVAQRSALVYQFARILHELRPTWFLFENVPGLLSSNDGRDFAEVLRLFMVKCGYGIQWRVLDSQFFGVAQRRRRLFIVGRFGKPCPAEILFEPEGGRGDFPQSEEAWADIADSLTERRWNHWQPPGMTRRTITTSHIGLEPIPAAKPCASMSEQP